MLRHTLAAALLLGSFSLFSADAQEKEPIRENTPAKKERGDAEQAFNKIDANKDGKLSREELKNFFDNLSDKLGGKGAGLADRMFDRIDANNDDAVTLEEFRKGREALQSKLGDNGKLAERLKGKIDPEKLKQLKEKLGKKE